MLLVYSETYCSAGRTVYGAGSSNDAAGYKSRLTLGIEMLGTANNTSRLRALAIKNCRLLQRSVI